MKESGNTYIRIRIVDKLAKLLHGFPNTHAGPDGSLKFLSDP